MNGDHLLEIRIQGHLDDGRSAWFGGMTVIRTTDGETILRGLVADQAAVWGLLARVRDLGLPLLAVQVTRA